MENSEIQVRDNARTPAFWPSPSSPPKCGPFIQEHSVAEQGRVKFYNTTKAFGFITRDGADDVFVHKNDLKPTGLESLTEGQQVTFDVVPGRDDKPKAVNVRLGL